MSKWFICPETPGDWLVLITLSTLGGMLGGYLVYLAMR